MCVFYKCEISKFKNHVYVFFQLDHLVVPDNSGNQHSSSLSSILSQVQVQCQANNNNNSGSGRHVGFYQPAIVAGAPATAANITCRGRRSRWVSLRSNFKFFKSSAGAGAGFNNNNV